MSLGVDRPARVSGDAGPSHRTVGSSVSSHLASPGMQPECAGQVAWGGGVGGGAAGAGTPGAAGVPPTPPPPPQGRASTTGALVQAGRKGRPPPAPGCGSMVGGTFGGESRLSEQHTPALAAVSDGKFLPSAGRGAAKGATWALPREPPVETMWGGEGVGGAPFPQTRGGGGPGWVKARLAARGRGCRDRLGEGGLRPALGRSGPRLPGPAGKARPISCGRSRTRRLVCFQGVAMETGRCRYHWSPRASLGASL